MTRKMGWQGPLIIALVAMAFLLGLMLLLKGQHYLWFGLGIL